MKYARKAATGLLAIAASAVLPAAAGNVTIKNMFTDKEVWITTYNQGQQIQSFCVGKGATKTMTHSNYGSITVKVRAEVVTGPSCKGTKTCDTDMEVDGKGTVGAMDVDKWPVYVWRHAADPNRCYLSRKDSQEAHRLTVNNTYKDKYVWMTSMTQSGLTTPQIHSGCIEPGKTASWVDDRYQMGYHVRAEVMTAAACKGDKVCDTKMWNNGSKPVFVRQNGTNCFIDTK